MFELVGIRVLRPEGRDWRETETTRQARVHDPFPTIAYISQDGKQSHSAQNTVG